MIHLAIFIISQIALIWLSAVITVDIQFPGGFLTIGQIHWKRSWGIEFAAWPQGSARAGERPHRLYWCWWIEPPGPELIRRPLAAADPSPAWTGRTAEIIGLRFLGKEYRWRPRPYVPDRADLNHPMSRWLKVSLDGQPQKLVQEYSISGGWVRRVRTHENGRIVHNGKIILDEIVRGRVTVTLAKPDHRLSA